LESEYLESELSSHSGSDEEYSPPQTASSCSDEDVNILDVSSDEALEVPDTDSKEDENQQAGKCKIKKHKTFRTYVKRKRNKEKIKKDEVKSVTVKTCSKREDGNSSQDTGQKT